MGTVRDAVDAIADSLPDTDDNAEKKAQMLELIRHYGIDSTELHVVSKAEMTRAVEAMFTRSAPVVIAALYAKGVMVGLKIAEMRAPVYRTKTGRVLTDADIEALAREAEEDPEWTFHEEDEGVWWAYDNEQSKLGPFPSAAAAKEYVALPEEMRY